MDIRFKAPSFEATHDLRKTAWVINSEELFRDCPVGASFELPLDVSKLSTLRSAISRLYNKGSKKFKVIQHDSCYEIYRKE